MFYKAEKAKRGRRQVGGKGVMAGRMRDDAVTTGYVEHLHNIDDCARQSAFYEQPHNMRLRVHSRRENFVSAHPTQ